MHAIKIALFLSALVSVRGQVLDLNSVLVDYDLRELDLSMVDPPSEIAKKENQDQKTDYETDHGTEGQPRVDFDPSRTRVVAEPKGDAKPEVENQRNSAPAVPGLSPDKPVADLDVFPAEVAKPKGAVAPEAEEWKDLAAEPPAGLSPDKPVADPDIFPAEVAEPKGAVAPEAEEGKDSAAEEPAGLPTYEEAIGLAASRSRMAEPKGEADLVVEKQKYLIPIPTKRTTTTTTTSTTTTTTTTAKPQTKDKEAISEGGSSLKTIGTKVAEIGMSTPQIVDLVFAVLAPSGVLAFLIGLGVKCVKLRRQGYSYREISAVLFYILLSRFCPDRLRVFEDPRDQPRRPDVIVLPAP